MGWRRFCAAVVMVGVAASPLSACQRARQPDLVIGVPEPPNSTAPEAPAGPEPAVADDGPGVPDGRAAGSGIPGGPDVRAGRRPEPPPAPGLARPDGQPFRPPLPFRTDQAIPEGLTFILIAGSDARPGEDLRRTRADSVHLLAINPATRQGTVVGFPRDSYVDIPGHGRGKLNSALALGGPDLLAATVRRLTKLPVDFYVLTGFVGFARIVDDLGGVDVQVTRRMNDKLSGARFEPGWHRFSGDEALAFARNRNDVADGDFSRSEHQGVVMLAALAKMRAEVADDGGVLRWTRLLLGHAALDLPPSKLAQLGALARRIDPTRLTNVVAPGRVGTAGSASVVYLTDGAGRLFDDLRPDAVVGRPSDAPPEPGAESGDGSRPPGAPSSSTTAPSAPTASTTSTTGPSPVPTLPTP